LNEIDVYSSITNKQDIFLKKDIKDKLDLKIIEALFSILYKKKLINKKEYNLLIAQLNHKLHEIPE